MIMIEMNNVIARNISKLLKAREKKQVDLAAALDMSKQTVSKMLSGERIIGAAELVRIAEFLEVKMEKLVEIPVVKDEYDNVRAFMGRVESEDAKNALKIADEIADMILFHARIKENNRIMSKPWGM